jgi:hypothetical protein
MKKDYGAPTLKSKVGIWAKCQDHQLSEECVLWRSDRVEMFISGYPTILLGWNFYLTFLKKVDDVGSLSGIPKCGLE